MEESIGPLPSSKIYHSDERAHFLIWELKNRRKHPASRVNSFRLFSSDEVDYATISGLCESTADVHISIDTFGPYDPFNNPFWLLDAMYYKLQETGGYRSLTEDAIKQLEDRVGDDQQRFYQGKIMEALGDCSDSNVCVSIDFPQRLESSFGDSLLEGIHNAILLFEHYSAMVVITAPGFRSQQWLDAKLLEMQESAVKETLHLQKSLSSGYSSMVTSSKLPSPIMEEEALYSISAEIELEDYDLVRERCLELCNRFPLRIYESDLRYMRQLFSYNTIIRTEAAESTAPQEGDIVRQARVINHLTGENEGIVFRLNKKITGVYWRNKMTEMEWTLKDATMAVNSAHDVEITSSRYVKSKKRWQIQVKTGEKIEIDPLYELFKSLKMHRLHGDSDVLTLALYYAVALETFKSNQPQLRNDESFWELISVYKELTVIQGRGSLIDKLKQKPINIHECFEMKKPAFGLNIYTKMAILEKAIQQKKIILDPRLKEFVKHKDDTSDKSERLLEERKFLFGNKENGAHLNSDDEELAWYKALKLEYNDILKRAKRAGVFGSTVIGWEQIDTPTSSSSDLIEWNDLHEWHDKYTTQPKIALNVIRFQEAMRYNLANNVEVRIYGKKELREILGAYGDLGVPIPISPYDSSKDEPSNVLEAIERISHNNKNQGLRTHNRINGFLDMLWLNQHRRESYGNRFIGLDLLDEFTELSSNGFEEDCAKKMLFHSQKVIRLMEKVGGEIRSVRTNKISRQNLYSRLIFQFESYLEDPETEIDRMARPRKSTPLRNLLQPIRLHTENDPKIDQLPYGLVTQTAFRRIEILILELNKLGEFLESKQHISPRGDKKTSPMIRDSIFLRTFASLVAMEVCQLHMMSAHLPIESKSSKFLHIQTRNTVEHYDELQGQKMDLEACTIDGENLKAEKIIWEEDSSILEHLKTNNLPTARDLIHRLCRLCLPSQKEMEILSKTVERGQIVRFVGSLLQFCDDESPTGQKYVEIARTFDQIYVDHMPTFMSPDVLSRGMFEYY